MNVVDLSISKKQEEKNKTDHVGDQIRVEVLTYAKNFKTAWVNLGRHLYAIHEDKLFFGWGHDKFEDYTEKELGMKKSQCMKLLKAYLFAEQDEPEYLSENFPIENDALNIPNYDALDVLRAAKAKKELLKSDYERIRKFVFDKGKDAGAARKELGALIKERVPVDPEEERNKRNAQAIKKLISALGMFQKDMQALKLVPTEVIEESRELLRKLSEVSSHPA